MPNSYADVIELYCVMLGEQAKAYYKSQRTVRAICQPHYFFSDGDKITIIDHVGCERVSRCLKAD